jgi:hypothetical protein
MTFEKDPSKSSLSEELEEGSSTRDIERWINGALGMGRLSLKRLIAEGPWGRLLYWGPRNI